MDASPPSNANNTRVFLSYGRKDGAVLAARLHDQLQAREHDVWQDVFDMHGGDDWWLQIEDRIGQAGAVVLVVTPAALASDIVRREWVHARRTGVPIFPVVIGSREPPNDLMIFDLQAPPNALKDETILVPVPAA